MPPVLPWPVSLNSPNSIKKIWFNKWLSAMRLNHLLTMLAPIQGWLSIRSGPQVSLTARGYHVLAAKFAAVAVGYAFVAFLSRRLDAPAFGQVAFFLSFAALISVIGGRGQHMAVLRFVPGSGP